MRQEGQLVAPADHAAEVYAPLLAAFLEPHRPERDHHLHRPALVEVGGLDLPQAVPVVAGLLVGDLPVEHATLGIGREAESVATVIERVEHDRDVVVVVQVAGVTPHVAGDPTVGMGLPQARADVDVLVIEEHPDVGLVAGRATLGRFLLQEAARGGNRLVERLVEPAVEGERRGQARGAQHRMSLRVARDHLGRDRRILRRRRSDESKAEE